MLEARTSTKQQPMNMEKNYFIAHYTDFSKPFYIAEKLIECKIDDKRWQFVF